jgi:hypothetical protein
MNRITVDIPDELPEHEDLTAVLYSWNAETPIPEEVRRHVRLEMDEVGLTGADGNRAGRGK